MEKIQKKVWQGEFGEAYLERNRYTVEEVNQYSIEAYGVNKIERLERFLADVDRDATILEVGSNIGTQLKCLQEIGFENLYGIDIQQRAVEEAHQQRPELHIIKGDALDIPFKDGFFDLVFTSGVLIHIPPKHIEQAISEISRCTSEWVYGCEYYAEEYTEINYRGQENLLWKTDFPALFEEISELDLYDIEHRENNKHDGTTVDVEYMFRTSD